MPAFIYGAMVIERPAVAHPGLMFDSPMKKVITTKFRSGTNLGRVTFTVLVDLCSFRCFMQTGHLQTHSPFISI